MLNALAVGCGGFIGAVSRYMLALLINKHNAGGFPIATLIINIVGSFLIGLLSQLFSTLFPNNKKLLLFLTTGILGGFTTFSTFSLETVNLYQNGDTIYAVLNVVLSVLFCLVGVVLGKVLARIIAPV